MKVKILKNGKIIKRYFISGHRNITQEDFEKYYAKILNKIESEYKKSTKTFNFIYEEPHYVIGDYEGVDTMAQDYLAYNLNVDPNRVTIYHMGDYPMNCANDKFLRIGGFATDDARDEAMTMNSDEDIAYVYSEKVWSGTAQNILRRFKMNK